MTKKKKPRTTLYIKPRMVEVSLADNFVCGGVQDRFTYSADLMVRGLTEEGFVTEVKNFIDQVEMFFAPGSGMRKASCEELAGGVVHVAHELVGKRLEKATVIVKNLTGSVILIWEKGRGGSGVSAIR